ncbi:hypothetical protein FRB96_006196 [Tulasnella sp. 330]|nr:hypothetical protein FRB96_006196 [Tulasnella sp. 330]
MAPAPSSPLYNAQAPTYARWHYHTGPRPESSGWRFVKAFALASAIYLLLGATVESIFHVSRHVYWGHPYWYPKAQPNPADGHAISCHLEWTRATSSGALWTSTSRTSLPIGEASTLFFHSTGFHASGTIRFVTAEPPTLVDDDVAIIDLQVNYWDHEAWDSATICTMQRNEVEYGIGIYTDSWRPWGPRPLKFDVTVTLPASQAKPLILRNIETQLSTFSHELDDLASIVFLDAVHLHSSNAHINVKSISTASFEAHTSNAVIDGSFNVTDKLQLISSNGHIDVTVQATNDDWEAPTSVVLATSNGYISATASLLTSDGAEEIKSKASGLQLTATTTNAHLDIDIPTAPPNSHIKPVGVTTNNRARLVLPAASEGQISSTTSNSAIAFDHNRDSRDPTGEDRKRHFGKETFAKGYFGIETWWGDDREEHIKFGNALIQTTNGAVSISLL